MATAQAQIIAKAERRRSERQPLALPLVVRGIALDTRPFTEETFTLSVSANGALLALGTTVTLGQALFLRNSHTQEEAGAWVTRFGLPRGAVSRYSQHGSRLPTGQRNEIACRTRGKRHKSRRLESPAYEQGLWAA